MRDRQKQVPALRKIFVWLLCLFAMILLAGAVMLVVSDMDARRSQWQRTTRAAEEQTGRLDGSLSAINLYLTDLLMSNEEIETLRQEEDASLCNRAARDLFTKLTAQRRVLSRRYNFFAYAIRSGTEVFCHDGQSDYADCMELRRMIKSRALEDGRIQSGPAWEPVEAGEHVYILQCYQWDGVAMACWIPWDTAFSFLEGMAVSGGSGYMLLDSEGGVLAPVGRQPEYDPDDPGWGCFAESFRMRYADLSLVIIDRPGERLGTQMTTLCFLTVILLIVAGFSVYTLNYFQRYIQRPFEQLQDRVNIYVRERRTAKRRGFAELNEAMAAFDSLVEQLNRLKIEQYEEKITLSRTELEFFQLQIKPHFFVNAFSIIYGMAQKKDFTRIQAFCLRLSEYVRYLFRDGLATVSLKDELKAVKDYLDIQDIRYRTHSVMNEEIPESLLAFQVPPVLLLTFVENAVKHARGDLSGLVISIQAAPFREEGAGFARMSVKSSGSAFSPGTLEALNREEPENGGGDGRHLGIWNVRRRLSLMYGDEYALRFSNDEGASLVEITLPDRGAFGITR